MNAQQARADIQGLRALAVVLVILFHLPVAISLRGGYVGVDMFFVISGFVVTNMVIMAENPVGHAWRSIGLFLRRRVMRLVPVAAVVIVATILLSIAFAPTTTLGPVSKAGIYSAGFLSNLFYAGNFDTYWDPAVLQSPFLHTWSLGVEFQTYLVFPLLLLAVFRGVRGAGRGMKSALVATSIVSVLSIGAFVYLLVIRHAPLLGFASGALAFYTPITRFWEFGIGIIVAIVVARYRWSERSPRRLATIIAWALIAAGLVGCTIADQLSLAVILSCAGVAIILANGARTVGATPSPLEWKPLVWIGDRSYSIYLWHWPLLIVALWILPGSTPLALASLVVTVALSMVSYRFVEQRFRRPRSRTSRRVLLPSIAFVVAAVLVAGSGVLVARQAWYATPVPLARASMDFPDNGPTAADVTAAMESCDVQQLQITCNNFPGAATVVIIGDSLGYRSTPAVQLAAMRHGYNTTMMWTGGCGLALNSCPTWIYDSLAKTNVAAIIVDVNYDRASTVINGNEVAAGLSPLCPVDESIDTCAAHLDGLTTFVKLAKPGLRQLDSYSNHILVALPFPQQSVLVRTCLSVPLAERTFQIEPPRACGRTSVDWQSERQGLYPSAITKLASADSNVTLWDPTKLLCVSGECPSVINGGEQIMDDAIHLSPAGSRLLYPEYDAFIDAVKADAK